MKVITTLLALVGFQVIVLAQPNKKSLIITHLTGDFYVYTTYKDYAGNPFPSNGMYLLTDAGAVIFDTPWDSTQFQPLLDSIQIKHHKKAVLCIATHSHDDRTAGLEFFTARSVKRK
jgi:glyoxylase-like metal-dependent hydrolase (beta-lactamase superfamily II)